MAHALYQIIYSDHELPPADEADETIIEVDEDGVWRAWDQHGLCASANSFKRLFERMGNRWN